MATRITRIRVPRVKISKRNAHFGVGPALAAYCKKAMQKMPQAYEDED